MVSERREYLREKGLRGNKGTVIVQAGHTEWTVL